jgi:hypothetical protein
MMSEFRLFPCGRNLGVTILAGVLILAFSAPAEAVDLSPSSGKFRLNIDTTLSWGGRYRVAEPDLAIIGTAAGGTAYSVNGDDGNQNFEKGSIVSNTLKATIDVGFSSDPNKNTTFGVFVRGSGFKDFALDDDCCERTLLTQEALDWAGSRTELLDAYAWLQFPLGKGSAEIRAGRQVLNWGESTYIQGGISVINPVDVSALRVPGAELREAFRPQGMVWGSVDLSPNLSLEAFYQYEWEEIVIDPPGTYFSTNDFVGPGGTTVFLGWGDFPDTGEAPWFAPTAPEPFLGVPRGETQLAEDGGQYGLALRWFVPSFGGTEFGLYYINYHSRLPTINSMSGTEAAWGLGQLAGASAALAVYYALGVPPGVSDEADQLASNAASAAGQNVYAKSAYWFTAYPEDIKLYGLSWNAQLGTSGIAFQGEISYKQDAPYQADDVELLFATNSPISDYLSATNQLIPGGADFEEEILGYRRLDSSQLQFTLTKIFSNFLGADQGVILGEFGFNKVFDMPSKDELRFEGPGTYVSGNPLNFVAAHPGKMAEEPEHFADDFSWGYRLVSRLTYNNAIGAWSLAPRISWQHDVDGVTPGPGGSFIAGRKALTIGLQAAYQGAWQVDLSYTQYSGAGRYNLINDRDFVGGFIKYSF